MGIMLRNVGTTEAWSPRIKRATHVLSSGIGVMVVPDTNRTGSNGEDTTGVAKIYVYTGSIDRSTWTKEITFTPSVACASSTRGFIGSSAMAANNNLYVAYQGVDNSLHVITWIWNGTGWNAGTDVVVQAAGAIANRFRAIDIDVLSPNSSLAVAAYEANGSTGQGGFLRVYVRLTDGTTWRRAYTETIFSTQFIQTGSEDVSVAWNLNGAVANVANMALYYTKRHTTGDLGDTVREISFNVLSGAADSATTVGTWFTTLNKNEVSQYRRGWLYSEAANQWIFANSIGAGAAQFSAARIYHNSFTDVVFNKTQASFSVVDSRTRMEVTPLNLNMYVTTECRLSTVFFAFAGVGTTAKYRVARGLVIRFDRADLNNDVALSVDSTTRMVDQGFKLEDGVIAIAGGGNERNSQGWFTFMIMYGAAGDSVSNLPTTLRRQVHAASKDTLSRPTFYSPKVNPGVNQPTLIANMQNVAAYANVLGKFQWQWARDTNFTVGLKTITQTDDRFQSFSSTDGYSRPTRSETMLQPSDLKFDFAGTWYGRVRMVDDLGGFSAWSDVINFVLSHPPTALPRNPSGNSVITYKQGFMSFSWQFSDTETFDYQTAYQVIVSRVDTGAIIADTGKVVSSASSARILVPFTNVAVPLQWSVRLWDMFDTAGQYSTPNLFTMYEAPTAIQIYPANAADISTGMPTIAWNFVASGNRTQKAFRITIWDDWNQEGLVLKADSGWVISSAQSYTFPSTVLENETRYRTYIEVQDNLGLRGGTNYEMLDNPGFDEGDFGWSINGATVLFDSSVAYDNTSASLKVMPVGGVDVVLASEKIPAVPGIQYQFNCYINFPSGAANPDLRLWLNALDASGADIEDWNVSYAFKTFAAGQWNEIHHFTAGPTPPGTAFVTAWLTIGSTVTSGNVFHVDSFHFDRYALSFDTDYVVPAQPTVSVAADEFKVIASWDNSAIDLDFRAWRVYRRYMKPVDASLDVDETASTWELIYETLENKPSYSYHDYLAPLNKPVEYAVVQLVDRFGELMESDIDITATITQVGDRYFFVPEVPIGSIASFEASSITGDAFTREIEQETLHVIGRGRQVQIGDDLGYAGSFTVQLRNPASARFDREFFELLSGPKSSNVYVKSPFGDVLYIALGSVGAARIPGVGLADMADLTIPYTEVFRDLPITRLS